MAGQTYSVDIGDEDLLPPWSTVFEVARAIHIEEWMLVGGLMVQLHALRASIPPNRATIDMDVIADVLTSESSLSTIAGALGGMGFVATLPESRKSPMYRYSRGDERVDVMVADHLPSYLKPRLRMRPAFVVEAGAQALSRRDTFNVVGSSGSVTISAPDVLGALIAKSAASIVDPRHPQRHLEDAALLLASIDSVGGLALTLSKNDRKRLNHVASQLKDALHPAVGPRGL